MHCRVAHARLQRAYSTRKGKPLEPVTRGTFNYTGVSVLSLKHDDDTATGNRAAVASAPLPSPTFGMVVLSSGSSASQHASI
jgi:hypothetical protein